MYCSCRRCKTRLWQELSTLYADSRNESTVARDDEEVAQGYAPVRRKEVLEVEMENGDGDGGVKGKENQEGTPVVSLLVSHYMYLLSTLPYQALPAISPQTWVLLLGNWTINGHYW